MNNRTYIVNDAPEVRRELTSVVSFSKPKGLENQVNKVNLKFRMQKIVSLLKQGMVHPTTLVVVGELFTAFKNKT